MSARNRYSGADGRPSYSGSVIISFRRQRRGYRIITCLDANEVHGVGGRVASPLDHDGSCCRPLAHVQGGESADLKQLVCAQHEHQCERRHVFFLHARRYAMALDRGSRAMARATMDELLASERGMTKPQEPIAVNGSDGFRCAQPILRTRLDVRLSRAMVPPKTRSTQVRSPLPSCPGSTRASTRSARNQPVDGRVKPGHDVFW